MADRAAVPALPPRTHTVELTLRDPNSFGEHSGLATNPSPPRCHEREKHDDHDQIDAEHCEQRDEHSPYWTMPAHTSITRRG